MSTAMCRKSCLSLRDPGTALLKLLPSPIRPGRSRNQLGSAPRPVRAQRGPAVRRRPDRGPHPRRPRRTWCPVPRPGVQPRHDPLGLPLPGAQRRPQLPRRRDADHRPPGGQRPAGLLAQPGQLLQRPGPPPHRRPAHSGAADRTGVAGRSRTGVEVERPRRVHRRRVTRLHAGHARLPRSSTGRSPARSSASCTSGDGRERSTSVRSSRPCRWTSCDAVRRRWYARRSGRTCWRTTCSGR